MRVTLVLIAVLAWPSAASACRELTPEHQFEVSDTVIVGRISHATIPELDSIKEGTTDREALNHVMAGNRTFRIVVTETRKGLPIPMLIVEVDRCTGAFNQLGERVIAYHDSRGWRVARFPAPSPERGP